LRILLIADVIGATQQISFLQPLQHLIAAGDIQIVFKNQSDLKRNMLSADDMRADIIILSRLSRDVRNRFRSVKHGKTPLIFHIDDDLFGVPESLGQEKFSRYGTSTRLDALRGNVELADLVYASTIVLKDTLLSRGITTPIVAGGIYCTVDPATTAQSLPSLTPVIGYMGSKGHVGDLAMVVPAIERLMDEMPELRFETYGTIAPPEALARFGDRVGHHPPTTNYVGFVSTLCSLGWWIGLAPLEDTPFNRCKADTKWVEYSHAGIPTIASDLPVYGRACADGAGLLVENGEHWYHAITTLLDDAELRGRLVERAQAKLVSVYNHAALERQLLGVFERARQLADARTPGASIRGVVS
jgi:glycosyltransferase involved in cell wall biosynthesis